MHERQKHGTNETLLQIATLPNSNKGRIDQHRSRKLDCLLARSVLLQHAAQPKETALTVHCEQCDPASKLQEG